MSIFSKMYCKKFFDPKIISLFAFLSVFFCISLFFYDVLIFLFISILLSYILNWPVQKLIKLKFNTILSISVVLFIFVSINFIIILVIFPVVWKQGINLVSDLPYMVITFNKYAKDLPKKYPYLVDAGIIDIVTDHLKNNLSKFGESVFKYSVYYIISIFNLFIYLILMPFVVFFLLKDKNKIIDKIKCYFFYKNLLIRNIFLEINNQISNYVKGKFIEMIIICFFSYVAFVFLKLKYSLFMSLFVGFFVLIPYIGALVTTIALIFLGIFQWGIGSNFWNLMLINLILQFIDGILLSPILFSEAIKLHPLIIFLSVVVFGKIWNFWGVFFAIPLAILIKAIINALPKNDIIKISL